MSTITLAWHGLDLNVDGYNVYRSDSPMDPNNLPSPIASVGPNIGSYDDSNVVHQNGYYYRVGVIKGESETVGPEQKFFAVSTTIISVSNSGDVKAISTEGEEIWSFADPSGNVSHIAHHPETDYFYIRGGNYIKRFNFSREELSNPRPVSGVYSLSTDRFGTYYVGRNNSTFQRIDIDGNSTLSHSAGVYWVRAIQSAPNGDIYYSGSPAKSSADFGDNTLIKLDSDGNRLWKKENFNDSIQAINLDKNGNLYAGTSSYLNKINPDTGDIIWALSDVKSIEEIDFNKDGFIYVAGGYREKTIRKVDPEGNLVWVFRGHTDRVVGVAVDQSTGYIYSSSNDNTVKKIDTNGNEVWTFSGHTNIVNSVIVFKN